MFAKNRWLGGLLGMGLMACGGEEVTGNPDGGTVDPVAQRCASELNLKAYLNGKVYRMAGNDIPTHPNGYNENVNFGSATQCYNSTELSYTETKLLVTTQLGTLLSAPNTGDVGMCDRNTVVGTPLMFETVSFTVENIASKCSCFDFTANYGAFQQEGRGSLSEDGKTMRLELFFKDQATNHRCAAGAPGTAGVTVQGMAFTGNGVQTYQIKE